MIKKSYSVQMSYDVSDTEKNQAEQALLCFKGSRKATYTSFRSS